MTEPPVGKALFLNQGHYRRRRLRDAARLLPILGTVLFVLPLLWRHDEASAPGTALVAIYLFLVWGMLIAAAAVLSRRVLPTADEDRAQDD